MSANKYVLDTHVWISLFHSKAKENLIDALIEKDIIIISTGEQRKELLHVMHYPEIRELMPGKQGDYLSYFHAIAEMHRSDKRFALLTDYKDNYLVDLAWQNECILVSDDRTFKPLRLLKHPKVEVISKRIFYKILGW